MKLEAPAKINLSLKVCGKREDGFHEIETLMVSISLRDELTIEPAEVEGVALTCSDASIPSDDTNLVVRAAKLFFARTGLAPRVKINLLKRIPHGAGLGGGSSDAAATLLGLNDLFDTHFKTDALAGMAAELGSDIPFFIHRSAALCRGRGELISPVQFPQRLPLLLLKPPFGVPTPWAYTQWRDSVELPGIPYASQKFSWGELTNDLERPVFQKYIFLAVLKRWLLAQPETVGALMSGSGSTCFAVLRDASDAVSLAGKAAAEFESSLWTWAGTTG